MKKKSETLLIPGPVGNLEIRIKPSVHDVDSGKAVVISHPHPLYGGTMNNKVVTTMERAFSSLGYTTVAYNFRGVGGSDGDYDSGIGEKADLKAVLDWLSSSYEVSHTVLAGFSFGSFVSLSALAKSKVNAICTVAPPVGLYDFSVINDVDVPWTLIQGGQDEVVSAQEILDWVMKQKSKPDIYWRDGASHFFHGELVWLRKIIELSY